MNTPVLIAGILIIAIVSLTMYIRFEDRIFPVNSRNAERDRDRYGKLLILLIFMCFLLGSFKDL